MNRIDENRIVSSAILVLPSVVAESSLYYRRVHVKFTVCVSHRTRGSWEAAYYQLEPGYYRLVLEAIAGSAAESMNIAVDDLDIGLCGVSKFTTFTMSTNYKLL